MAFLTDAKIIPSDYKGETTTHNIKNTRLTKLKSMILSGIGLINKKGVATCYTLSFHQ